MRQLLSSNGILAISLVLFLSGTFLGKDLGDSFAGDLQKFQEDEVDQVITIEVEGSNLQYETTRVELEAGTTVTLRLDLSESSLPHNLVLVKKEGHVRPVAIAGLQARKTDYVPESESDRIVTHTELARPGKVVEVTFEVPPPGEYPYVCTYPGHFQTMRGVLVSVE